MPITHTDGNTYYSKDEMENAVKDRIKNVQAELAAAEAKYKAAEPDLAQLNTLKGERDTLTQKLAKVEGGLNRFKVAAGLGITDGDTLWALEQAHERAMTNVPEADRAPFEAWLPKLKADPNLAPSYLRPVIAGLGQPAAPGQSAAAPAPGAAAAAAPATPGQAAAAAPAAPAAPPRPAWAPSVSGQQPAPGGQPKFADRVRQAASLDDLAKLQSERLAGRG